MLVSIYRVKISVIHNYFIKVSYAILMQFYRLVGPRCLSCCLMEGIPIPSGVEPVFTIAMRNLVVTASGLSKQQKVSLNKCRKSLHLMYIIFYKIILF